MNRQSQTRVAASDALSIHGRLPGDGDPAAETKWRIDYLYFTKRYQECLLEIPELSTKSALAKESLEISARCHIGVGDLDEAEVKTRQLVVNQVRAFLMCTVADRWLEFILS